VNGIADSVLDLIGNTPLVRLRRIAAPDGAEVLGKLESFNPAGSVKDRIALGMIEAAEKEGTLAPGGTIVEPTSGNTGIGLAMVAAVKGYPIVLVMPDDMTLERRFILRSLGAELLLTPAAEGMTGAIRAAESFVENTEGAFMPQQFRNPANPEVHRHTTAREIIAGTGGRLDAFVAGIGTGGTVTGVGEVLKREIDGVLVVGVEPAASPVLTEGRAGRHMIQGIGANFVPEVLDRALLDRVVGVPDREAFLTARALAQEEGLFVGVSAGAAAYAALEVARELGPGKRVVVVLPDVGERYSSSFGEPLLGERDYGIWQFRKPAEDIDREASRGTEGGWLHPTAPEEQDHRPVQGSRRPAHFGALGEDSRGGAQIRGRDRPSQRSDVPRDPVCRPEGP
jgi:cysteine synthase A